jgi:hypothetical protein
MGQPINADDRSASAREGKGYWWLGTTQPWTFPAKIPANEVIGLVQSMIIDAADRYIDS